MVGVKICGVKTAAAMDAAVAARADWVGFVFAAGSPRRVTPAQAEALSGRHGVGAGLPLRVGLFVDPDEAAIEEVLEAVPLDVLQLYVDAERAAALRAAFGMTVWRAIGVGSAGDLPAVGEAVDGYVVDAQAAAGDGRPGGNARVFDWSLLAGWRVAVPWLLAGGLTPGNVAAAIAAAGAGAVDVSSGVESAPGVKEAGLIAAFVAAARG